MSTVLRGHATTTETIIPRLIHAAPTYHLLRFVLLFLGEKEASVFVFSHSALEIAVLSPDSEPETRQT